MAEKKQAIGSGKALGNQSRREFLQTSGGAAAGLAFVPYIPWNQPAFANRMKNDRPRVGCIGVGGMGTGDAFDHARFADIVAVCDVDSNHMDRVKNDEKLGKGKAFADKDYRKILDHKDVDIVSIVTPDHWHVKIAIEALAAGKHVFCQKPLSLTLEENQLIREACKRHADRVFFIGTQQRSDRDRFLRAVNMVQRGLLGDIKKITVGIDGSDRGGPFPKADVPPNLDWDLWQGPAALADYRPQRCHGSFRWWYEYSGGKFTDWGAHHVDIATWAIKQNGPGQGPTLIDGSTTKHNVPFKDGYPTQDDSFNTATEFDVRCEFPGGIEMVITNRPENGILFEGTKGRMFVNRGKITGKPIEENWDKDVFGPEQLSELYKGKPFEGHKDNFYRCLTEGGLPVSDVYSHVQIMNTCHLAGISSRLGRALKWDPQAEKILGDDEAMKFFGRTPRKGFETKSEG